MRRCAARGPLPVDPSLDVKKFVTLMAFFAHHGPTADRGGRRQGFLATPVSTPTASRVLDGAADCVKKKGSSPISRVLSRILADAGQSFISASRYREALAAYPGALRATSTPPYLALPRMGFTVPALLPGTAVGSYPVMLTHNMRPDFHQGPHRFTLT